MADEEDIAALVIDNGSGMCKGELSERLCFGSSCREEDDGKDTKSIVTAWLAGPVIVDCEMVSFWISMRSLQ